MKIYIKIGTMPARFMHLCYKRKKPSVGDIIKVKVDNVRSEKAQACVVDSIKDVCTSLYMVSKL
jgi:hypothetical protein